MKRRDFLTTACLGGVAAASLQSVQAAGPSDRPLFLDFRMITASTPQRLEALVKHNGGVGLPIANKHGLSPVGLFVADTELNSKEKGYDKKYDNLMVGLTPHPTFDSTLELAEKTRNEAAYRESAAALGQNTSSKDPLYTVHERMLLRCYPEFPTVKVPTLAPNRILQLRLYRSHNFERSRAKVKQMTTQDGVIDLFAKCGMKPVFFSTTLFGSFMPSIVFMLSFENADQIKDAWAKFFNHADWKRLSTDPAYADTVAEVISIFLKPCKESQI